MVIIECSDRASAINLFQILNTRGLPLRNSDLIKSYLYRKLDATKKDEFKSVWTQIGQIAKTLGEDLDDLFTYYEYYLLGSNPKQSLYEELEAKFDKRDPSEVIYDFRIFIENLGTLNTEYPTISSLRYLRNQIFWKAIILTAKKENFQQVDGLIKELKRFFYCYWIADYTTSKIKQTAFNIIVMIKTKKSLGDIREEINKKFIKDKVLSKMNKNLNSYNVYEHRWIKPLLLLIEDGLKDESKVSFYKIRKLDADHILPDKWNKIPEWTKDWTEQDAKTYLNTLGNLTLIMYDKNRSAQNHSFDVKKEIYNGKGKFAGEVAFRMSQEVAKEQFWKKEQVIERQNKLLLDLQSILNIDFKEAIVKEENVIQEVSYWLTPVSTKSGVDAIETIKTLVEDNKMWAFSESNQYKDSINIGDSICFYAAGIGIVADAKVASKVEQYKDPNVKDPDKYGYVFSLSEVRMYIDKPIPLDLSTRQKMPYFKTRDSETWAWFVQSTRKISEQDFKILTGM